MQTMKRIHHAPAAATLFATVAFLASCVKTESAIDESLRQPAVSETIIFNATVTPKGVQTRSVNEAGETTWVVDEKIAVYYEKEGGGYGTATASVDAVNGGKATISASLSGAKDGGTVKFVYPASLVNATGDGIDIAKLQSNQHGTIADISANFDAATATATLATDGTTCSTTATISFDNQVLIGKFTPTSGGAPIEGITTLTVTAGSDTYTVKPSSGAFGTDGIYVAMLPVDNKTVKITAATALQNYLYPGKSLSLAVGQLYTNLSIAMTKGVNLSMLTADCTVHDGETLTGTLDGTTQKVKVTIEHGATVILSGATINGVHTNDKECLWAGLTCEGDAVIVLADGTTNTVTNFNGNYPCLQAAVGKTLVIKGGIAGTGKLIANNDGLGAGIGGGEGINCGNIEIQGGDITAKGGESAGIGGGCGAATCGNITISGGTIVATSGGASAGIGSGDSRWNANSCGNISITGGNVTAASGGDAAGIGCGACSTCGNITISGGSVRAQGFDNGTGIGCGIAAGENNPSVCGTISISGSVSVVAIRGDDAFRPIGVSNTDSSYSRCGQISFDGNAIIENVNAGVYTYDPDNGIYGSLQFKKTTQKLGDKDQQAGQEHIYDNNTWTLTPTL